MGSCWANTRNAKARTPAAQSAFASVNIKLGLITASADGTCSAGGTTTAGGDTSSSEIHNCSETEHGAIIKRSSLLQCLQ